MKAFRLICQVIVLTAIAAIGNAICTVLHWPIPGSMVGLVVLFTLLKLGIVKVSWFDLGANWLLSLMLLFFVPAAVGIIQYGPLLAHQGIQLVLVIAISTVLVMGSTGAMADRLIRRKRKADEHSA